MIRKLSTSEHILTRPLYEHAFPDDSKEFVDYYYRVKARDNVIYVIENEGEIVSMLHLNPYRIRVGNEIHNLHYIVAVATHEKWRRKGFMSRLMEQALSDMQKAGEVFTFLMPAKEEYYIPFGFRTLYKAPYCMQMGDCTEDTVSVARKCDCEEMAYFRNKYLSAYDVTVHCTGDYFETLLEELQSEGGGIHIFREKGEIVGLRYFTRDEAESEEDISYMIKVLQPDFEEYFHKADVFLNEVV